MNSLTARRADELPGAQFAAVRAIYEDAFPARHRVPFAGLAQTGPHDAMHVALDGDMPVGFAAVKLLDSVGWVFLRYFAIDAARRRERLGRSLWEMLLGCLARDGWPGPVCFEVEDPAEAAGDEPELLVRQGRVRFWEACGAVRLPVPGFLMPGIAGPTPPEPVLLMAPAAVAAQVTGDELAGLVRAIYTQRYGLPGDDPLVRRAVESIRPGS